LLKVSCRSIQNVYSSLVLIYFKGTSKLSGKVRKSKGKLIIWKRKLTSVKVLIHNYLGKKRNNMKLNKSTVLPHIKQKILKPKGISASSPKLDERGMSNSWKSIGELTIDSQNDESPMKSVLENRDYLDDIHINNHAKWVAHEHIWHLL